MKYLYTLMFALSFLTLHAQPTMTAANDPAIGDNFTFIFVDSSAVSEGTGGANQTWDFSNAVASGLQRIENWVDPASTPYQSSYPTANIAQVTVDSAGNVYSYHLQSSSQTELLGIVSSILANPADMHYTNSEIIKVYPGTYNDTYQDSYDGMAIITVGPITATNYRTGTTGYVLDGYGTLITPSGNFPNTLRMKVNQVYVDSTVFIGVPLPTQIVNAYSTSYFWGSCDAGDKEYQFYIGYDTTVTMGITTPTKSSSYQDIATGIQEHIPYTGNSVTLYPNPSSDIATVRINNPVKGNAVLRLYDMHGSLIKSVDVFMQNKDYFEWQFRVSDLASGLYSVAISCNDQHWTTHLLKQ